MVVRESQWAVDLRDYYKNTNQICYIQLTYARYMDGIIRKLNYNVISKTLVHLKSKLLIAFATS